MANFYDILKNVCVLAHEDLPSSFSDTDDPYPEIKRYIQDTLEEVCSKFPWTFREKIYTLNTVDAQREYSLPSDLSASNILEDGVRIQGYNLPLYFIHHSDLDKLVLSSGKSYRYSIYAGKLILDPTPDDIYHIQIKYLTTNYAIDLDEEEETEKANLDLETDIPILPERFIKVIEWGAFALYRQNFKTDEKYKLARNKFLELLLDMQKQDGYGKDSSPNLQIGRNLDTNVRLLRDYFDPKL